jgi:fatty-acyl-CoA synthase
VVEAALKEMEAEDLPLIVEVPDEGAGYHASGRHITYDQLLAEGDADFAWIMPEDEWERSRSTTPPAPRGGPRAWSITTGART